MKLHFLSAKNRSLEFIKYFIYCKFEIQKTFISESTLKIHNTKHNSQPANTDNPKILLTVHNLPDYWAGGQPPPIPRRQTAAPWDDVNDYGGEASSGQLLFSSCSWVRSTKTPPARFGRTPSQTTHCRCSILQSLVDAPSWIDTPTTAASRSDLVNLFAPWPRGAALCTPARLPSGVSPPFRSVTDIWPWMSHLLLVGPFCQTKTVSPTS